MGEGVDEAWAELRKITAALDRVETRREDLFARRLVCFQRLVDAGVKQVDIAPVAKITPMAVSFALHRARKGRPATAANKRRPVQ